MAKILLVDDNDELLGLVGSYLRRAEHVVTTATNGREALRKVQASGFDLVITDIFMPEKEGLETIRELLQKKPPMKIIAISGGGSVGPQEYLDIALKFGIAKTLAKPFSKEELLAAVDGVLAA